MSIQQVKSLVQFSRGTKLVWETFDKPIPDGVVIYSTDDGVFKLGDGVSAFKDLPTLFTYANLISAQGGISELFEEPVIAQNGNIVIISTDPITGIQKYVVSETKLTDLITPFDDLEADNTAQDAVIVQLMDIALSVDSNIGSSDNDEIIVVNSGRYMSSGFTLQDIRDQAAVNVDSAPGSHMDEPMFYSDSNMTIVVDKWDLYDNTIYYVDILGFNNTTDAPVFGLTSLNTNIAITQISGSKFRIQLNDVTGNLEDRPAVLVASVDNALGNALIRKAISIVVKTVSIFAYAYGSYCKEFNAVTEDSSGNIIAVGTCRTDGTGSTTDNGLIVKFDANLNILAKKVYAGSGFTDIFYDVTVDVYDNIYVVGVTTSEGQGSPTYQNGLIIKFDSDLNIVYRKIYSGDSTDYFAGIAIYLDEIFVIGPSLSQASTSGFIVKFNLSLGIISRKAFEGSLASDLKKITVVNDTIYVVGSGVQGSNVAVILKIDRSLNVLATKYISSDTHFENITSFNNALYVVGRYSPDGLTSKALVVKFDLDLNVLIKKTYATSNTYLFYGVKVDSYGNVWCVGKQSSQNYGLIVKFDANLNNAQEKLIQIGGNPNSLHDLYINSLNNVFGFGEYNDGALIFKFPNTLPSGSFSGTVLSGLSITDGAGSIVEFAGTFVDATVTTVDSTLTLTDSTAPINSLNISVTIDTLH